MVDQELNPAMDELEQGSPMSGVENGKGEHVEDVEEMDAKSKALMHLLNTSEVCFSLSYALNIIFVLPQLMIFLLWDEALTVGSLS
jgi:hypothetical protein